MKNHQNILVSTNRPSEAPVWSTLVERWNQLDDTCFTFCEALCQWGYLAGVPRPDCIFLVLPQASNQADYDFVSSGAISPAKFIFTLPNICASVLFQILKHSGRTFCLSSGEKSIDFALTEALAFSKAGWSCWVFTNSVEGNAEERRVHFYDLTV